MFDTDQLEDIETDHFDHFEDLSEIEKVELRRKLKKFLMDFRANNDPFYAMAAFRFCANRHLPPPQWIMDWLSIGMDGFSKSASDDSKLSDLGEFLGFVTQKSFASKPHLFKVTHASLIKELSWRKMTRFIKTYGFSQAAAADIVSCDNSRPEIHLEASTSDHLASEYSRRKKRGSEYTYTLTNDEELVFTDSKAGHIKRLRDYRHPELRDATRKKIDRLIAKYEQTDSE